MIQQPGILLSMLSRTYSFIADVSLPDIWVMDPKVQFIDDSKPLLDTQLYRVRGVRGVEWAVPLYKGSQKVRLANGEVVTSNILGLDDATLIGGPAVMLAGQLADLHLPDAVIVDEAGAKGRLATPSTTPGGKSTPLRVGDVLEINDKRALVAGIARATPTFQPQPIIFTTYTRAKNFALNERKLLSYVLVKAKADESAQVVAQRITDETDLVARTADEFKRLSLAYFVKNTGVLINFGFVVLVGFIVGTAVTGQIFYNFTLDNLRHFGVFKAMGTTDRMLVLMILLQALLAGLVGFGLGAGATAIFAAATQVGGAGIVEASTNNISIGTSLAGVVRTVFVTVGDTVKAGAPLFQIDDREWRAELLVKQANVVKAKAAVEEAKASLQDAQAQYALVRNAVDGRAVSVDDVQKRRNAELPAKAKVESAKAEVTAAEAEVKATQSSIERLTVRAPITGEVLQVNIRPGEYAPTGALDTPLLRLGESSRLHIRVDIDENDAWRFTPGTSAVASLRGNRDLKTELTFVRVEPYVTPKTSLTGSSTERVDTRVLQIIYSVDRRALPAYVGQQVDVFIETPEAVGSATPTTPTTLTGGQL